jgi:hypothetical protein
MTEPKESRTVTRAAEQNRIKSRMTIEDVLSTATTVAGLVLMLTTHDTTTYLLAACLVANEAAKEVGR